MKKTVKTIDVVNAYRVLSNVKIGKLEEAEQSLIAKAIRSIRSIAKEYIAQEEDLKKMLQPENIEELGVIEAKGKTATVEELVKYQTEMGGYMKALDKQTKELSQAEVEIDIAPIGFDVLRKLASANDQPLGAMMIIDDLFGE